LAKGAFVPENLVLVEQKETITTLTINRPEKRNSMNPETLLQMADAIQQLREEGRTRVLIIRGAGEAAFSSGFDISRIGPESDRTATGPARNPMGYALGAIADFPFPVIAMIYGYCVGGGLELAVTCDLRFASEDARLGITPAKLGLVYNAEGIRKFINLVGPAQVKELFFTGRLFDAQWAMQKGLIDHILPAAELAGFTHDFAAEIAANAPMSVAGVKLIVSRLLKHQKLEKEDDEEIRRLQARAMLSEDLKEGRRAFLEKRKPNFKGR
jgi:enoyl-CoA hydratase/carnithine racemase